MGDMVAFTDNINDLSNTEGYQFEFICERCGNGHRSEFMRDKKSLGKGLLRGAGSLIGGKVADLSYAAETVTWDRGTNSAAKDKAMRQAVDSVKGQFKQCRGCGNWVCVDVCWNGEIGQCLVCSPSVADELSRAQAAAQVDQIREKATTVDWTKDLDIAQRAKVTCGACNASVKGGKFCPECGETLSAKAFCGNCGTSMEKGKKFCPECGEKQT